MKTPFYRQIGKRAIDLVAGCLLLVLLFPLMVSLALLVWLTLGRPILFRQQRPGFLGRPFMLFKFRTMSVAQGAGGEDLPDAERVTPIGRMLRRTSVDELPELFNVLRGDMSLVGPRPLLMEYLPRYSAEQWRRHEVLPGMTGPVQVAGRNALSWPEKFRLDIDYVDNVSFSTDMTILWRTAAAVITGRGASQPGFVTVQKFTGNDRS